MAIISIIIPVYNGKPFIKECIESVLNQSFQDWELCISDNGSTDGSVEYLQTLSSDSRIRIFYQEKNLGIFGNLNFLITQATSDYIYILCADDFFLDGALNSILESWLAFPNEVAMLRFNFSQQHLHKRKSIASALLPAIISPNESDFFYYLFSNIPGNLSNISLRRGVIEVVGPFDEKLPYAGDYDFWSRLGQKLCWSTVEKQVSTVRRHSRAASKYLNKNGELVRQYTEIRARLYERLVNKYPKHLLQLHGSWRFIRMIDNSIWTFLKTKNTHPLREVKKQLRQPMLLHPFFTFLMYFMSGGGRLGRHLTTHLLYNAHVNSKTSRNEFNTTQTKL